MNRQWEKFQYIIKRERREYRRSVPLGGNTDKAAIKAARLEFWKELHKWMPGGASVEFAFRQERSRNPDIRIPVPAEDDLDRLYYRIGDRVRKMRT